MSKDEAIHDLIALKDFFEEQSETTPMCLEYAIKALEAEPCEDCVSRQAAIVALDNRMSSLENVDMQIAIGFAKGIIHGLPSVTQERRTGHWVTFQQGVWTDCYRCSECGKQVTCCRLYKPNECRGCGAKMVEPQESEVQDADSD